MSVQDATAALNEDTALFAFLPTVNAIFITFNQNAIEVIFATSLVAFLSAAVYNIVSGEPSGSPRTVLWVFRILGLSWLLALVGSMALLLKYFNNSSIVPEILFFISLTFISLLLTDTVLNLFVGSYESQL